MGDGPRLRLWLGEAAMALVGDIEAPVTIVGQGHERTGLRLLDVVRRPVAHELR